MASNLRRGGHDFGGQLRLIAHHDGAGVGNGRFQFSRVLPKRALPDDFVLGFELP